MSRYELTDEQWAVLELLVPKQKTGRGRSRAYNRCTLNGIIFVLETGCAWEYMPREYESHVTCWRRLSKWSVDGT